MGLPTTYQVIVKDGVGNTDLNLSTFTETSQRAAELIVHLGLYGDPVAVKKIDFAAGTVTDVTEIVATLVRGILLDEKVEDWVNSAIAFVENCHRDRLVYDGHGDFIQLALEYA